MEKVAALALSPDGNLLAVGTDSSGVVGFYETAKGVRQGVISLVAAPKGKDRGFRASSVRALAYSPDGKKLAVLTAGRIFFCDMVAKKLSPAFLPNQDGIRCLAYSPDGKFLATAGDDKKITLWDAEKLEPRATLVGHTATVVSLAFSPDSASVASASADKTARVWDTATGKERGVLNAHTEGLLCVAFSPDGKLLASSSGAVDKTVRLWDAATLRERSKILHQGKVEAVAFSADSGMLYCSDAGMIKRWDLSKTPPSEQP
jgi:WD40 repeat protein